MARGELLDLRRGDALRVVEPLADKDFHRLEAVFGGELLEPILPHAGGGEH